MDKYGVFGNPIGHSKSPVIHQLFAEQTGQALTYQAILAPLDGFSHSVASFFTEGRGANVTVPFKEQAFALVGQLTERARRAGAVNTLVKNPDGTLTGDNTDGAGLVRDLTHAGISLTNKKVLILGAGGAVRGILEPFINERPSALVIANRTVSKAEQLAKEFADIATLYPSSFDWLEESFDVIINGTAASLGGEVPPISPQLIHTHTVCYDMMYSKTPTAFCQWALDNGAAQALDGLGMLVEQAAESFYVWRGLRPDTAPVLAELRRQLAL